jgi:hypothetical protein
MEKELLLEELRLKLNEIERQNHQILPITIQSIHACREILSKMSKLVIDSSFKNDDEEIHFFKNIITYPLSQLIYFSKIRTLEIEFPKVNFVEQKKYIKKKMNRVNKFYIYNVDFIQYIVEGKSHFDSLYFTRSENNSLNFSNTKSCFRNPEFSTSHDLLLAQFKAYNLYYIYLKKRIDGLKALQNNQSFESNDSFNFKWTKSNVDLTELIYALYFSKAINDGRVQINEIAAFFEKHFNLNLGDFYRTFSAIKNRKKNKIIFLEQLKSDFKNSLEDFDY